jgi:hypothetical protein
MNLRLFNLEGKTASSRNRTWSEKARPHWKCKYQKDPCYSKFKHCFVSPDRISQHA